MSANQAADREPFQVNWMEVIRSPLPDLRHYRTARRKMIEPVDLSGVTHPRLSIIGWIDDGIDWNLVNEIATYRPDYQLVLIGPLAYAGMGRLERPNIHYLGPKSYADLPAYLAAMDVVLLPLRNELAHQADLPARVKEYLAAGKTVVSTPLLEIMRPFGGQGLVWVAGTESKFIQAIDTALSLNKTNGYWLNRVDSYLTQL